MVAPGGHAWLLWGACMVAPGGMHGCSWGSMHGCSQGGVHGCSQGGHAWLLPGGVRGYSGGVCMVALGGVWLLQWGACMVAPGGDVWNTTRYGDTVNEWAVRILLECILFYHYFAYCLSSRFLLKFQFRLVSSVEFVNLCKIL